MNCLQTIQDPILGAGKSEMFQPSQMELTTIDLEAKYY